MSDIPLIAWCVTVNLYFNVPIEEYMDLNIIIVSVIDFVRWETISSLLQWVGDPLSKSEWENYTTTAHIF